MKEPPYVSIYDNKDELRTLIDWGSWKHSWHLSKQADGNTDWCCRDTAEKCLEILEEQRDAAIRLAARSIKMVRVCEGYLKFLDWEDQLEEEDDS